MNLSQNDTYTDDGKKWGNHVYYKEGIYPLENPQVIHDLFQEEWGFDGFVMTDWESYATIDSVKAVKAGVNLLTPGKKKYVKLLVRAVKRGDLSIAYLQQNVKKLVETLL